MATVCGEGVIRTLQNVSPSVVHLFFRVVRLVVSASSPACRLLPWETMLSTLVFRAVLTEVRPLTPTVMQQGSAKSPINLS